ncbi:amidohydrolase family protein [Nocardia brevicatena]|uniref:amidohydrolase family protein n=1 Tax=Nocardia brevicatena TaxID=37327 RepID=UPI0009FF1E66|nr:amidohydrolase family protein [Nocardia brevicatena]
MLPSTFVDAHAHFWQVSTHDWYPMLRAARPALYRDYLLPDYLADAGAAGVHVTGLVHVSATTAAGAFLHETRWLNQLHRDTGRPSAIIGAIDPQAPFRTIAQQTLAQAAGSAFRGVRVFAGLDPVETTSAELLRLLGEHNLVFDQIIRPAEVTAYLPLIEKAHDTAIVLEHAGLPEGTEPEPFRQWRDGIAKLAALPNVDCKISGLGAALGSTTPEVLRPFVETCLELFGIDRCFFGSNFPVDGIAGSYTQLLASYQVITAPLSDQDRRNLFSVNATRRYRLG